MCLEGEYISVEGVDGLCELKSESGCARVCVLYIYVCVFSGWVLLLDVFVSVYGGMCVCV